MRKLVEQIARIRWNLSPIGYGNTELSRFFNKNWACVETRGEASYKDDGIVLAHRKMGVQDVYIAVILLGAVAWIEIGSLIQRCISVIPLIRGNLNQLWHGNPELASFLGRRASVETIYGTSLAG